MPKQTPVARPSEPLRLWVWEGDGVLEDYTSGLVCVLAPDEAAAWDVLKEHDRTAWWSIRCYPENRDDPRTHEELDSASRPRCVEQPEAFVIWGS
jgi:hypothetical protein